ncbi:MAG: GOLPH3/VPS74 family protein [Stackebrandtia sp.]
MLLADDCWLVAHDATTGRALLPPRLLGVAAAAGLLAELLHSRVIAISSNRPVVVSRTPPPDQLQRTTAEQLAREKHPIETWLRYLARSADQDVAHRLIERGLIEERQTRSFLGKTKHHYVPTNSSDASWPGIRVASLLTKNQPVEFYDQLIIGWIDASGLTRHVLWDDPEHHGRRYLEHVVSYLPAEFRGLFAKTNAIMNEIMLSNR